MIFFISISSFDLWWSRNNDQIDFGNIQTTRCDIRRDQQSVLPFTKFLEERGDDANDDSLLDVHEERVHVCLEEYPHGERALPL